MGRSMVAQVAELEGMTLEQLREKWNALYNTAPPVTSSRQQLVGRLAYRLQELVYGGLSEETKAKLESLGRVAMNSGKAAPRNPDQPVPGTKLIREWQGERKEVTVLESGFEYAGKTYRSLSAIATEITGTKWNGPDFFGLRRRVVEGNSASAQTKVASRKGQK